MILHGDCLAMLKTLPDESVNCCVTSPPYWGLRDYGVAGQIGLEATPDAYVAKMVEVFREVRRVLKADGTLWLNLGDSYAGSWGAMSHSIEDKAKRTGSNVRPVTSRPMQGIKPKDLVGIPWRVAFALQADGWYLRSDIIWAKPNPMPESVTDRPTKAHEYIFLMSKSDRYWYDHEAVLEPFTNDWLSTRKPYQIKGNTDRNDGGQPPQSANENGRNKRSVWTVTTQPYPDAHFATFPPKLIEPCILAGCPPGGIVLDPFLGSGTTLYVAKELNREGIGIELNAAYITLAERRLTQEVLPLCP
jgi:DNA modification methylase